jgi:hypothetical protein
MHISKKFNFTHDDFLLGFGIIWQQFRWKKIKIAALLDLYYEFWEKSVKNCSSRNLDMFFLFDFFIFILQSPFFTLRSSLFASYYLR